MITIKIGTIIARLFITFLVISFLFKIKYNIFDATLVSESFKATPYYPEYLKDIARSTVGNIFFSLLGIGLIANTYKDETDGQRTSEKENMILFASVASIMMIIFLSISAILAVF